MIQLLVMKQKLKWFTHGNFLAQGSYLLERENSSAFIPELPYLTFHEIYNIVTNYCNADEEAEARVNYRIDCISNDIAVDYAKKMLLCSLCSDI